MGFLRRSSKQASAVGGAEPIVTGRCWFDTDLDVAVDAIEALPPAGQAEARLRTALGHLEAVRADPERQALAVEEFADRLADVLDEVRVLISALEPGAGRRDAEVLLAATITRAGWKVRGSGWSSTVGDDAARTFHAMLEESDELLGAIVRDHPEHAAAGNERLVTALGLGMPSDEWWHRFEVACTARPTLFPVRYRMLTAQCEKWYGSHDLAYEFGVDAATNAPEGDPVSAVLPLAHAEFLLWTGTLDSGSRSAAAKEFIRRADEIKELVAAASDRWLAGGEAVAAHPRAPEAHQLFGWFFGFTAGKENKERARNHFQSCAGRVAEIPWTYTGDPAKEFAGARRKAAR